MDDKDLEAMTRAAASDPHSSHEVLAQLASHGDMYIRAYVAENPSTPPEILLSLVDDEEFVQRGLARNKSLPIGLARILASRTERSVLEGLIDQLTIPAELLLTHVQDPALSTYFLSRIVRQLLWLQLARHGAFARVDMTNQYRCWDGMYLAITLPAPDGARVWDLWLHDPEYGADSEDSSLFSGLVMGGVAPERPDWSEFTFVNPTPVLPDDEMRQELESLFDFPPDVPPINDGRTLEYWALIDLMMTAHVDNARAVRILRGLGDLEPVGSVEVRALDYITAEAGASARFESELVLDLLASLRKPQGPAPDEHDYQFEQARRWARLIVEPLLVATPETPLRVIEFIASDPQCPAMELSQWCPWIHHTVRTSAQPPADSDFYGDVIERKSWETSVEVTRPPSARPPGNVSVDDFDAASEAGAPQVLSSLVSTIHEFADTWHGEDQLDFGDSLSTHKDFQQASMWLGGSIWVPEKTLQTWQGSLELIVELLDQDSVDAGLIEQVCLDSWLDEPAREVRRQHRYADRLVAEACSLVEAQDWAGARSFAEQAADTGNAQGMYLMALLETVDSQDGHEAKGGSPWLHRAWAAGSLSAGGDLATQMCSQGQYSEAIELLTKVSWIDRTVEIWVPLSWAWLMQDQPEKVLEYLDDTRLRLLLEEEPTFRFFTGYHDILKANLFSNHLTCAMQVRDLTPFEVETMNHILTLDPPFTELHLVAADIATRGGRSVDAEALLDRLQPSDVESIAMKYRGSLKTISSDSNAHHYLTRILELISKVE